jgi:membrane-bound serine protease (ClpP class)
VRDRNGRAVRLGVAVACMLAGLLGGVARAQTGGSTVVGLHLDGVVDPLVADYLTGGIARAQDAGAAAVVLEIDTPGGWDSSMREIVQGILNAGVPVLCYVSPQGARAASAGAFILLSCPVAAMAPGTNVGASTPVGVDGGDLGDKIQNDAAAYIQSLAERYERNAELAKSLVTEAESVSADQALRDGLIELEPATRDELLAEVDGWSVTLGTGEQATISTAGASFEDQPMGSFLGFLHALFDPNLAFIFFWLGLALIVLELLVPGHIFSGTIGTIMLIIAVWSFGLLPIRLIGVALLILSVVAFVIELKAPGLGVWGIVGTAALLAGGWFLYDRAGGVQVSPVVLLPVAAFVALFFGVVVAKVLRMRHLPPAQGPQAIVGREGVVIGTGIGPGGGVVRVAAEEWRAVSAAAPISTGTRVRVTALDGLVLAVEPIDTEHPPAAPAPVIEGGQS